MKRFHVSVAASDLQQSVNFYTTLFGAAPTVRKTDYAKWMLDDPSINFSISESKHGNGVSHVGLQMDSMEELAAIQERLQMADEKTVQQPDAKCCYSRSSKTWVRDPDNVAWEAFVTHGEATHYGDDSLAEAGVEHLARSAGCCKSAANAGCCI